MKLAFALLLLTSSLGAVSSALAAGQVVSSTFDAGLSNPTPPGADLTLIDGDEDDDDECEEDDDEGGDGCAAGATGNAAKAGTAPPPRNGLFTDGTAPVVKSN